MEKPHILGGGKMLQNISVNMFQGKSYEEPTDQANLIIYLCLVQ